MRRLHALLVIIALSLLGFVACDEPEVPQEPPTMELLSSLVTVEASGGEQVVGFVVTNPDGSTPEGRCADSWCHSFTFPEEGMMRFVVEPNVGNSSRITNVYIKYGEIEEKFTLSQAGLANDGDSITTMDFNIQYEIDGPQVTMTVSPEYDNVRYYFAYSTKAEIDAIGEDKIQAAIKANVESFLQGEINALVNYGGYSQMQALDEYTGFGVRSASMTVNARTDYVGWACAISNEVRVISDVVMKEFRTGDVPPSDNVISLTIDGVNCDRVSFTVDTTNEDQYAVYVLPAEEVDGKSDEDIVALFNTSDDVTLYLQFGDYTATRVGLAEESDYYVVAYGYKWGMATTAIQRAKFRTTAYEGGGEPGFTFNVNKVTNISFGGTVATSPASQLYYLDYCDLDTSAETILMDLNEAIDWYVNDAGYYPDRISLMRVIGTRGTSKFNYSDEYIVPNGQYRVYVIAIDETTGEFCSDVIFSDTITTLDVDDSVRVEVSHDEYFDAANIASLFPEMGFNSSEVSGYAMLPLVTTAGENIADYYVDVFVDDLSDTTYPTDDQLFASMRSYSKRNTSPVFALCEFYDNSHQMVTVASVAVDKNGNRGPVTRTVLKINRNDCAHASEFEKYIPSEKVASCTPRGVQSAKKVDHLSRLKALIKSNLNE